MRPDIHIETERLLLRDWTEADLDPFAAINADPRVMEFYPAPYARQKSDEILAANQASLAEDGYGKFAVEEKTTGRLLGHVGLSPVDFPAAFAPAMEIGWRLARESWGNGYATEAATAVLDDAFLRVGLTGVVSFTAEWNRPSRRVMEKLGMTHHPELDFIHPAVPAGHKLAPHVLYRLSREDWMAAKGNGGTEPPSQDR
jgi:RimJ/RimL family protein N-acetyltransferase